MEGETPLGELAVRQKLAGDGKDLPDAPEGEDKDKDASADVAFAWFAVSPATPQPLAMALRLPSGAGAIQLPEGGVSGQPARPQVEGGPLAVDATNLEAAPVELKAADLAPPTPVTTADKLAAEPTVSAPAAPDQQSPAPIRIELPATQHAATPRSQPVTLAEIQPRAEHIQPLATPLAAAAIEAPATRRAARSETTISALATPTAEAPRTHAVPATPDVQQPALDLRRHEAMTSMIERIEAMRDTPGARETSIRLSPDALGTVDISIRHDGDRVHVHFSADTPAARAALAEAQPRLAELAESRGLRLGQTSIDGGAAGQGQRQDAAPRPAFTSAPASALSVEPATDSDERIA